MIRNKIFTLFFCFASFFAYSQNCDLVVSNLNDAKEGSLREALACASTGDTISFTVNGTIDLTSGQLDVTTGVIINADDADITLDAMGNSRIMDITSQDQVSIRNIKFINGDPTANLGWGGAITGNGPLNLINCVFDGNTGEQGGALNHNVGPLNIINCSFLNNTATNTQGGAINLDINPNVTIINSIFYKNFAPSIGGAIVASNNTNLRIINSTFTENATPAAPTGFIGAIYNVEGNTNIFNSIISDSHFMNFILFVLDILTKIWRMYTRFGNKIHN